MSETLQALTRRVREAIPLAEHLAFRLVSFDNHQLTLTAPLAPNHNDKGTFFAGSQSALLTLAGWSLTTLLAEDVVGRVDVVAVESNLRYQQPLAEDLTIFAETGDAELDRFHRRLTRRGKASLKIQARALDSQGTLVSRFEGLYLARQVSGTGE